MPTYDCKEDGCDGKVTFPEKNANDQAKGNYEIKMIVIGEEPRQCSKCGKSWFESELQS